MFLISNRKQTDELHRQIICARYGDSLAQEGLSNYLTTHYGSLTGDFMVAPLGTPLRTRLARLARFTTLLLVLSFFVFLAYAFFRLFVRFGIRDILVWISLMLTLLFTTRAVLLVDVPDD